jgi:hypothetical protein
MVSKFPENKIKKLADIRFGVEDRIKRPLEPHMMEIDDLKYASPILYEVYHNNKLIYGENIIARSSDIVGQIKPRLRNGRIVDYYVRHWRSPGITIPCRFSQ